MGDESALKIHVHTDDPGAALSLGTARGAISGVEIADMHVQTAERKERLTAAASGSGDNAVSDVVAVVAGTATDACTRASELCGSSKAASR